jgi:hypothetical protein
MKHKSLTLVTGETTRMHVPGLQRGDPCELVPRATAPRKDDATRHFYSQRYF